ncbi:MAG TPA: YceI family protein [Candidatus Eisenbacteria bacterium]|jgi:polyisoprenoid-binding protein YceI|nr:YceI family protein [Candidatus Eisenbacteria bacterium]
MRKFVSASILALTLAVATAASAAPATWTIDQNHSQVGFSVRHFFSKVPGTFSKFSGSVVYDPQKPENSSVKADIDPSSIDTKNEKRDNHLRSEDFFDVAKFPTLTFVSTKVTSAGKDKLKVDGNLTMHGVTKPVTLDVTFLGAGPSREGEQRSGFEAKTTINRKDFGILWNKTLDQGGTMLGDDVDIQLNVEGVIRPDQPASPPKS